jgi:DNA recombination protein RmuC
MEIVFLLAGLAVGALLVFLWSKSQLAQSQQANVQDSIKIQSDLASAQQLRISKEEEVLRLRKEADSLREQHMQSNAQAAQWKSSHDSLKERMEEQKQEVEHLRERFNLEFRNIANELLEDKSKRFTETNKENIDLILKPLKEKIAEFEKTVDTTHKASLQDFSALREQIGSLKELNQQMSKDAINLTKALKGETKTQGNWGEFILESVLEKSGLTKGREYVVQESHNDEDGRRFQPDVIIRLPEGKSIVIDSKVSLVGYEKMVSAEDEAQQLIAGKEHLASLRAHIKGLSEKNYQQLHSLKSLDFVLLFVPIEPAFAAAVQLDQALFNEAFDKNIVVVSPTTLLATLRTIASIWRQEYQNQNAQEIADQGGKLYDKFVAFTEDLIKLGNQMDTAKKTYEESMKKLTDGSGNLITRVEKLKKLGARSSKVLPTALLNRADPDAEDEA